MVQEFAVGAECVTDDRSEDGPEDSVYLDITDSFSEIFQFNFAESSELSKYLSYSIHLCCDQSCLYLLNVGSVLLDVH